MTDNVHSGHRARMREKLLRHGADVFDTYELLEMLLYYTVAVKDTNPIAKALLSRFSGIAGIFRAEREELLSVPDVGGHTAELLLRAGEIRKLPVVYASASGEETFDQPEKMIGYLTRYYSGKQDRCVVLLSFDNEMRLIAIDEICHGEFGSATMKTEDFVRTAIRRNASAVVIAHNQFGRIPMPKAEDHCSEIELRNQMKHAGVEYRMHFIISGKNAYMFPIWDVRLGSAETPLPHLYAMDQYEETCRKNTEASVFERSFRGFLFSLLLTPFGSERAQEITERIASVLRMPSHVFELTPAELVRQTGIRETEAIYLRLLLELYLRQTTDAFRFGKSHSDTEINEYLTARFLGRSHETVFLLCIDKAGRTVACEMVGAGCVNSSQISPRQLLEIADACSAETVVLAHNHPSGKAEPSADDTVTTQYASDFLRRFGITLKAHRVFAGFCHREITAKEPALR